jgi:PIN domain nuclease of toxin-antitoxin system
VAVSAITVYEVAWQIASGRIRRIQGYGTVETSVLRFLEGVTMRPITPQIAAFAAQFPEVYPRDSADRLIGATARAEGLTLVTRDEKVRRSPLLKTVW